VHTWVRLVGTGVLRLPGAVHGRAPSAHGPPGGGQGAAGPERSGTPGPRGEKAGSARPAEAKRLARGGSGAFSGRLPDKPQLRTSGQAGEARSRPLPRASCAVFLRVSHDTHTHTQTTLSNPKRARRSFKALARALFQTEPCIGNNSDTSRYTLKIIQLRLMGGRLTGCLYGISCRLLAKKPHPGSFQISTHLPVAVSRLPIHVCDSHMS